MLSTGLPCLFVCACSFSLTELNFGSHFPEQPHDTPSLQVLPTWLHPRLHCRLEGGQWLVPEGCWKVLLFAPCPVPCHIPQMQPWLLALWQEVSPARQSSRRAAVGTMAAARGSWFLETSARDELPPCVRGSSDTRLSGQPLPAVHEPSSAGWNAASPPVPRVAEPTAAPARCRCGLTDVGAACLLPRASPR